MFLAGFNQKTAKEDLIIKGKYGVPPRYLCGKTLEGSRSHVTKAEGHPLIGGAAQPLGGATRPLSTPPISLITMSFPTAFEDASRPLLKSVRSKSSYWTLRAI